MVVIDVLTFVEEKLPDTAARSLNYNLSFNNFNHLHLQSYHLSHSCNFNQYHFVCNYYFRKLVHCMSITALSIS